MAETTTGVTAYEGDDIRESIKKDYPELRSAVNIFDKEYCNVAMSRDKKKLVSSEE
jgi:hypothetical protein